MCNDFGNNVPYSAYLEAFSQIRVPIIFPTAAPNLEPRDDIWPTEAAPVIREREHGVELAQLRWGFPPARPKGAPIINFRSEGAAFPERALPRPGVALLRVHRHEIAEIEVEIHQDGRGLVLPRRAVAPDARWGRGRRHDPDNRAGARRGAHPQSTGGCPRPFGLAGLARSHPARTRAAPPATRREPDGRTGPIMPRPSRHPGGRPRADFGTMPKLTGLRNWRVPSSGTIWDLILITDFLP